MLFQRRTPPGWREKLDHLFWPRIGWKRSLLYFKKRILRLSATPHQIAAGVAAGVFCAFTPLIGTHLVASFIVAYLIGGNLMAATMGIIIGNPLTVPLFLAGDYTVGRYLLSGGHPHGHDLSVKLANGTAPIVEHGVSELFTSSYAKVWPVLEPMLIGSILLGFLAGLMSYGLVFAATRNFQRRRQAHLATIRSAQAG